MNEATYRQNQTSSMMSIFPPTSTLAGDKPMSQTARKPALPANVLEGIAKAKRNLI